MSLLRQWKGWSHLFRSSLFGLLRSWLANFERLQVIDLMEKVTKEQSKEATKSNGSFLGSWSWVIEPMIEGGFIRFLMTSQNKMIGIREDLNREKTFSFGHCPNYLTPPHDPNSGNLVLSDVKIQDLKVSLELRILYILYICNLKNS